MKKVAPIKRIKRGFGFLKRFTAPKKPKREKVKKPKSYTLRKLGAICFWLLFSFMFLVVFINVFSSSEASVNESEEQVGINLTTQPEAIQFAKDFSREFFTWNIEDFDDRDERLAKYLAKGLNEKAGLMTNETEWNSIFKGVTLKQVKEISENKAHIILLVHSEMNREVEKEVEVEKKDKKGKKKKAKETKVETEKKSIQKYFVVPVMNNGSTLGVYNLPYFTNLEENTDLDVGVNEMTKGLKDINDSKESTNIKNFLDTFFVSYSEDSKDKLAYILNDENVTGFNGSMNFIEVKDANIFKGTHDDEYIVHAEVVFEEPELKTQFQSNYYLIVIKENNRYMVDEMNAEAQIEELTGENDNEDFIQDENDKDEENGERDNDKEEKDS